MTSGDFKETYRDDIKIFQTLFVKFWLSLFIVTMLVFPFIADRYFIYLANLSGVAIIGALGMNLLTGYTGQVSLGHAAFLAIGAYTAAILSFRFGIPFWILIFVSGISASIFGLIIGIPSLRLRGLYLVITTMAFQFVIEHVIFRWESLTRGDLGIALSVPNIAGFRFDTDRRFYYLMFAMTALAIITMKNITRTRVGRAFQAIRDRDIIAETMGINLSKYKLLAFIGSSFYAGVAGALYAYYMAFISPDHFSLMVSIQYIAMIIVGGMGSILGSVLGAVFIVLLPEVLGFLTRGVAQHFPVFQTGFGDIKNLIYGLIIVCFLIYQPDGLYGYWRRIKTYFKTYPFTY
ncbi:MAG: branched-chain amino acid ABC transporter permease [Pseudomonadota bacterium]